MTFAPIAPTTTVAPTKIATDTYVIHQVQPALGQPLFVYINSMVILGKEPVIVDTGTPANRKQWLDDVFSLVEPEDVRWIFLLRESICVFRTTRRSGASRSTHAPASATTNRTPVNRLPLRWPVISLRVNDTPCQI